MKLDCVVPVFPLEPKAHSTLGRSRSESVKTHMLTGNEPATSQPVSPLLYHCATEAGMFTIFIYKLMGPHIKFILHKLSIERDSSPLL